MRQPVLVTGANGFIGRNLTVALRQKGIEVFPFTKDNTLSDLKQLLQEASLVYHLAGVNRPQSEAEFETGNYGLTADLIELIRDSKRPIPIVMSSSTQAALSNPYGISKKKAENAVLNWMAQSAGKAYVYRLPNVFGKWSRPNYNSVVATFCHNVAHGLPIQINNPEAVLSLAYIDDVVEEFLRYLEDPLPEPVPEPIAFERTCQIALQDLADLILSFGASRNNLLVANFEDKLTKALYTTYLSYLPEKEFGYDLEMKPDARGWFAEFVKSAAGGQISISKTKPGITRGNHWHHSKVEKFLVVQGEAMIRFRQLDGEEVLEYVVNGEQMRVLDIPPGYTHSLTNIGESDLITLFWANEIFDPARPDTYFLEV